MWSPLRSTPWELLAPACWSITAPQPVLLATVSRSIVVAPGKLERPVAENRCARSPRTTRGRVGGREAGFVPAL